MKHKKAYLIYNYQIFTLIEKFDQKEVIEKTRNLVDVKNLLRYTLEKLRKVCAIFKRKIPA